MAQKNKTTLQTDARNTLVDEAFLKEAIRDVVLDILDSVVINDAAEGPLTAQDTATVDGTYGAEEQGVIGNNRTRIAEIETALKNKGIIS